MTKKTLEKKQASTLPKTREKRLSFSPLRRPLPPSLTSPQASFAPPSS
ncbi:unnamed protein product, partial [Vitis vinifera]